MPAEGGGLVRRLIGLIVVGLVLLPSSAQASWQGVGGLRVHFDGNDTGSILDIDQVATGIERRQVFFGVQTYDQFTANDIDASQGSWFQFNLDTKRRGRADRFLYLYYWPPDDAFYCEVQTREGLFVGLRRASFDTISLFCGVRKGWLDIQKRVKFAVESRDRGVYVDRAPNIGRYRRL
jgi:hypothetical protein